MPSEPQEHPNVCNVQAAGAGSQLVHINLEEEAFARAVALLAIHPDWDMDKLANKGIWSQIRKMEIDDKYPLPDPAMIVCRGLDVNSVEDQVAISRNFLQQAQSELEGDNPIQAAKGVWGSIVYGLSAVGIKRGWDHEASGDIADQLGHEFNRPRFGDLVRLAAELYKGATTLALSKTEDYRGREEEPDDIHDEDEDYWGWGQWEEQADIHSVVDQATTFALELDEFRERQPEPFTIRDGYDRRRLARLLGIPRDHAERELPLGKVDPNGFSRNPPDDDDPAG